MPSVLDDRRSPALAPRRADPDPARHTELDAAARRWLHGGETPDNVAAYAHALRELIGDL
jgi:hypothetical protein